MNFQTFLKFSKIQYQKFLTVIFARELVFVHSNLRLLDNIQAVNYAETTVELKELGLLLILTPNNTDLTLTCDC